ncbi:hypothetical protein HPG69_019002 [Diceros bicornis minor]|uniref:Uncharacterized protein n=1 Tax=Diceros bicornis minor TaxID=77932 RepID=A0A7J7FH35_DICBM|nr:hypothetical protein HPG69_019002 [Diceros bicornis minor]
MAFTHPSLHLYGFSGWVTGHTVRHFIEQASHFMDIPASGISWPTEPRRILHLLECGGAVLRSENGFYPP